MSRFEKVTQLAITILSNMDFESNLRCCPFDIEKPHRVAFKNGDGLSFFEFEHLSKPSVRIMYNNSMELHKIEFANCTNEDDMKVLVDAMENTAIEILDSKSDKKL